MRDYPTLKEVLAIHEELIALYGGIRGVRDPGAIEAALFRPKSGYYADIVEEAAALTESLLINHPFIDGNKRIAFAMLNVFLRMNGHRLTAEPAWIQNRVYSWLEEKENRFQQIVEDLRTCITE